MAFSAKHTLVMVSPDDPAYENKPSDWNADHAITGELAVANGGTGLASGTSGGVIYFSAAGTLASSAALASNSLVIGGGAGAAPFTSANLTFVDSTKRLTVGTGNGTSSGWVMGYEGTNSGYSALWWTGLTPTLANYALRTSDSTTSIGSSHVAGTSTISLSPNNVGKLAQNSTAGEGLLLTAGTATTDVAALSLTRTNNNAAVATGVKWTFTDTLSAAGFLPFQILGGVSGTTNLLSLSKVGDLSIGAGAIATTALSFGTVGTGYWASAVNALDISISGFHYYKFDGNAFRIGQSAFLGFNAGAASTTSTSSISVISPGVLGVGTGAAASVAGQLQFAASKRIGSVNNRSTDNKILYGATTDGATAVSLTTDGAAGGAANQIAVPTDTTLSVVVNIGVKQSGSANAKQMLRQFLISNNAGTTAIQGSVTTLGTDVGSAGLATVSTTITADDTNDVINIAVNGVLATNLRYTANVISCETLYA